ncbi:MAG: hypothetical protein FWC68_03890, partial [Oscillospiraceae bacterium]|nr:hypothetical protein [Oscillospiraceae bacterium]
GTIEELSAELERMKNLYADALAENEHAVEVPLTIDELDLSSKVYGILKFRKLDVVEEIVALGNISALKKIRGLGENSYKEIVTKLETVGVTLDEDGKFVVGNLQVGQISSTRPSTLDFSEEDISIKEAQLEACQDAYERRMSTDERMQMIVAIHEQVALIEETMGRLNDDSYMETEVFDIEAYIVTVTDNRMSLNEMPIEGLETLLNTLNGYINKLEAKINAVSIRGAEENVRS